MRPPRRLPAAGAEADHRNSRDVERRPWRGSPATATSTRVSLMPSAIGKDSPLAAGQYVSMPANCLVMPSTAAGFCAAIGAARFHLVPGMPSGSMSAGSTDNTESSSFQEASTSSPPSLWNEVPAPHPRGKFHISGQAASTNDPLFICLATTRGMIPKARSVLAACRSLDRRLCDWRLQPKRIRRAGLLFLYVTWFYARSETLATFIPPLKRDLVHIRWGLGSLPLLLGRSRRQT